MFRSWVIKNKRTEELHVTTRETPLTSVSHALSLDFGALQAFDGTDTLLNAFSEEDDEMRCKTIII